MTARALLAVAAALALSACGFTPLYGDVGASPALARVVVETPDTRTGFELRQRLEDEFAYDRTQPALWRLETEVTPTRTPIGRRIDDTVARYELRLVVDYVLTSAAGGQPLRGAVTATTTYAAAEQAYAGVTAQRDGEDRAVAEAARLLRLELARLVGRGPTP